MKRLLRPDLVRLLAAVALVAAALAATTATAPAQHSPCNPNVQTCL